MQPHTSRISRVLPSIKLNISAADAPLSMKNSDINRYSLHALSSRVNCRLLNNCSYENCNRRKYCGSQICVYHRRRTGESVTIVSTAWKTTVIETLKPSNKIFGLRVQLNESVFCIFYLGLSMLNCWQLIYARMCTKGCNKSWFM